MIDVFPRDVRYALRTLAARPGFATAAILTLALGIGANTAIFSVVDRVFLHPLPMPDAGRLLTVREVSPERPRAFGLSGPAYQQIAADTTLFEDAAAFQSNQLALVREGSPELVWGYDVTPNFFAWLREPPLLGRTFNADDVRTDAKRMVVLSHAFWQRRFGGDPDIVGKAIPLSNETFAPAPGTLATTSTVIGVMREGFEFPHGGAGRCDFWKPVALADVTFTRPWDRSLRNWTALVRLRPDVGHDRARAALDTLAARNAADFPATSKPWTFEARPLAELFSSPDFRVTMVSLVAAVGIVLLLACANIANLLMTQAESRRREFAIRMAVGADRGRLVRQLLVESVVLALLGGLAGWLAATWGTEILAARLPADVPRLRSLGLDARAFGFTLLLAVVTGALFGLVPAWQAARPRADETLRSPTLSPSRDRRAFRHGLVITQLALSVLVLFAAGLLLRSVSRFLDVPPGYDPRNLVMFMVTHFNISAEERRANLGPMTDAFRALPGVDALALGGRGGSGTILVPGRTERRTADHMLVGTERQDFFATYRIPLLRGRGFDSQDAVPGSTGVIVNETMARELWPGVEALGQVFTSANKATVRFEVIGVVGDVIENPERAPGSRFYEPYERVTAPTMSSLYTLRARSDATALIPALRATLWQMDRVTIPPQMMLIEDSFRAMVAPRRTLLELLAFFAVAAALLTAIGIYGVVAQSVASRTREIGLRLALGAQRSDVFRLIVGQGGRVIVIGVGAGLVAAPLAGRYLQSKLFGVGATDVATLAGVSLLLSVVALAACGVPARRAMRVDPSVSLRSD
jgi:predicted permease